jgi:hypothetical protein
MVTFLPTEFSAMAEAILQKLTDRIIDDRIDDFVKLLRLRCQRFPANYKELSAGWQT